MKTRSAKYAQREKHSSEIESARSSLKKKRKFSAAADLEEEIEHPSKQDYNSVRQALIDIRADSKLIENELESNRRELEGKIRQMKQRESELKGIDDRLRATSGEPPGKDEEDANPGESMFNRLRSEIHDFAIKYFGDQLQQRLTARVGAGWAERFMQATTPGEETYVDYLHSHRRCPMIIKAFIWRFICGTIFNAAAWSGSEKIRRHMNELQEIFSEYQHLTQLEQHFARSISEVISPFMRSSPEGHGDFLLKIIHHAIEFDREISKQLPRLTWTFSPEPIESPFDYSQDQEMIMQLHPGEKLANKLPSGAKAKVYLVVAPGLTQRGADNSPSTSFDVEHWLKPMEVTCVKPRRQHTFSLGDDGSETQG
ncbi:hypothetical protein J7T55_005617 [Diaporthe amygdali]|uniref:uncharacterized protein n=1 Tax=Phomopsis amygdali TaxID=1214568 RepID=UPI0022FE5945|nr:uncharacterized protein J7T55_005617 [Diaporthe amygdali]KAJ0124279.1 hypothetical protein J7T55_005617 [Diaporthe amygdali]